MELPSEKDQGSAWMYEKMNEPDKPVCLAEGLALSKLMSEKGVEMVVRDDEDDSDRDDTNPEDILKLDDWQNYVNLNCLNAEDENSNSCTGGPFDVYAQKMFNVRQDGKLKKFVVKDGVGTLVPDNSLVKVFYQAYQEFNEIPFDTTVMQNNGKGHLPVAINLAKQGILPGLYEAVLTMKQKEKAEFLIHHDLAYGKMGCPPRVPPECTVLFIVEIDEFLDCGVEDDIPLEDRNKFIYVHKISKGYHNLGNDQFKNGDFHRARGMYQKAINMLVTCRYADEEEEKAGSKLLVKLYSNAIICNYKLNSFKRICSLASDSYRDHRQEASKSHKIKYFWGMAKLMLGDYRDARRLLKEAQFIAPNNEEISKGLALVGKRELEENRREKMMFQKMMNSKAKVVEVAENPLDLKDEFTKEIKNQLEEFMKIPSHAPMLIRYAMTRDQEIICLRLTKDLGLYGRVVDSNASRYIEIKKPDEE